MKLVTLDKITEVTVDHKRGVLANKATDKRVTALRRFRFVYARYSKKLFQQEGKKWTMACSSPDSVTGYAKGDPIPCGSATMCMDCKPELTLGMVGEDSGLYVLETRASVARSFSDALEPLSSTPLPIFESCFSLSVALTTNSSSMSFAQVRIRPIQGDEPDYAALVRDRQTLQRVIDQKVDRVPGARRQSQDWGIKMGGSAKLLSMEPPTWPE